MSTRFYEPWVKYNCSSCGEKLKGVAYQDQQISGVQVKVEPCQRCLQCAEAEIEHLKDQGNELARRLNGRMQEIKQLKEMLNELHLRIEQQYIHYEGRKVMSREAWDQQNKQQWKP